MTSKFVLNLQGEDIFHRPVFALFLLALAIRSLVLLGPTQDIMGYDGRKFVGMAENILAGKGYYYTYFSVRSLKLDKPQKRVIVGSGLQQTEPLLPAVLVPFIWNFGRENLVPFYLFMAILSSVVVVLIFQLTERLTGNRKAAWVAACVAAIHPSYLTNVPYVLEESLQVPLLVAACVTLAASSSLRGLIAAGLLMGLAVLSKEASFGALVFLTIWMLAMAWKSRRPWSHLIALPLAAALVIAPWTVRNVMVYRQNLSYAYPTLVAKFNPFTAHGLRSAIGILNKSDRPTWLGNLNPAALINWFRDPPATERKNASRERVNHLMAFEKEESQRLTMMAEALAERVKFNIRKASATGRPEDLFRGLKPLTLHPGAPALNARETGVLDRMVRKYSLAFERKLETIEQHDSEAERVLVKLIDQFKTEWLWNLSEHRAEERARLIKRIDPGAESSIIQLARLVSPFTLPLLDL
ncbi:MAG: glycosyltransferase family 39 protein, partial [Candidatus Binatia bacterium]|nr:glycosyltransferase family 39 protein [Candidatus Binatia bacterium]